MIYQAAEIVKSFIQDISFVEKVGGLVKTYERKDGNGVTSRFPIAYNLSETECQKGKYTDLVPDGVHKSAIYFEGDRMNIDRKATKLHFSGDLKLVCWMNLEKLGYEVPFSPYAIPQVLRAIPAQPFNFTPDDFSDPQYQRVIIQVTSTESENIFSRYTYNRKYQFFPYDYFAINMNIQFEMNYQCFEVPEPGGGSC
jgi:hypothetical protein